MKKNELKAIAAKGEGSRLQFKQDIRNVDALAAEMVAFSNILSYRSLGSGIKRAIEAWPRIDFLDDRDGCLFIATVRRKAVKRLEIVSVKADSSPKSSPKGLMKTEDRIIDLIRQNNAVTTEQLGVLIGISKRAVLKQISKLKNQGRLRRIGPSKGGCWEVLK